MIAYSVLNNWQMIVVEVVDGETGEVVDLQSRTNEGGWRTGYQVRVLYADKRRKARKPADGEAGGGHAEDSTVRMRS